MKLGNLDFEPVEQNMDLVGEPTKKAITQHKLEGILVSQIDPSVSDTAAFCEKYNVSLGNSVNCVILEAKRGENVWYAACMIPAKVRADVNGIVRRALDAKKISFAPMDKAVSLTGMEYGAINPIGLPADWPILVDARAAELESVIIGSGVRSSKLVVSGKLLAALPNAQVLSLVKND